MLNNIEFDLWADGFDRAVGVSDEENTYPFAGYRLVLNTIYNSVLSMNQKKVLDIGFGTGTLSAKLYEKGCEIYGQDFSEKMRELSLQKMPNAKLFCGDFTHGLLTELKNNKYDAIVATYSLHHLTDFQKANFIKTLLPLLNDNGCIYIGDVAFLSRDELEKCKERFNDEWDNDEIYFVFDELSEAFPNMTFERKSFCSGVLLIRK